MNPLLLSGLLIALSSLAAGAAGIIQTSVIVNFLHSDDYEIWFLLAGALPFIGLLDLGTTAVMPRVISLENGNGENAPKLSATIQAMLLPPLSFYCLVLILFLAATPCLVDWFHGFRSTYVVILQIFAITSIIRLTQTMLAAVFIGIQRPITERLLKLYSLTSSLTGTYVAAKFGYGLTGIMIANFLSTTTTLLITCFYLRTYLYPIISTRAILSIWRINTPKLADAFLTAAPALAIMNFGLWFVANILGIDAVPEYSAIYQIGGAILMLAQIPSALICPSISKLHAQNHHKELATAIILYTRIVTMLSVFCAGLFIINIPNLETFWLNGKINISRPFAIIYILAIALESIQISLTQACYYTGHHRFASITWTSALLLCLTMPASLSFFGITGAAISMIITQACTCHYFNALTAVRIFRLNPLQDLALNSIGIGIIKSTFPIAAATLFSYYQTPSTPFSILISTLTITPVFLFLCHRDLSRLYQLTHVSNQ